MYIRTPKGIISPYKDSLIFVKLPDLGQKLRVDFTFTWDKNNNNNNNDNKNPHLNFLTGTVLGAKEQGVKDKR